MADFDIQNTVLGAHGLSGTPPTNAAFQGCAHVRVSRVPVGGAGLNRDGGAQVHRGTVTNLAQGCLQSTSGNGYEEFHPPIVSDDLADNPATTGTDETRFDDYTYYR